MKDYVILTINPGSSSTKCGLVKGNQVLMDKTVDHDRSEFADCKTFADQEPKRMALIQEALKESGIDLSTVDAVVGRGVGLYACEGGTYEIDDLAYDHATRDVAGIHHPATLGIKIAYKFGQMLGKPAFFVNPMPVDEMCDEARMLYVYLLPPGPLPSAEPEAGGNPPQRADRQKIRRLQLYHPALRWRHQHHRPPQGPGHRWKSCRRRSGTDLPEPFRRHLYR